MERRALMLQPPRACIVEAIIADLHYKRHLSSYRGREDGI